MKKKPNSSKEKKPFLNKKSKYKLNYNFSDKDITAQDNKVQQEQIGTETQPVEEVVTKDNPSTLQEINQQLINLSKESQTTDIKTQDINPKKKSSIKTLVSEILFWGGLALTAYGFFVISNEFFI